MKVCSHCGETYSDFIDFCFLDGEVLGARTGAVAGDSVAPGAEQPVGPRRTAAEPSAASMAATPVPRSARRSLIERDANPTYGPPAGADPDPDHRTPVPIAEDDEPEPPIQSLIETAPIVRPIRPQNAASAAPTPLSPPTADERRPANPPTTERPQGEQDRPAAVVPPAPVKQLVNTTPKAMTFAGEVVEPESTTMLFMGVGAAGVGVLFLLLGLGALAWMYGTIDEPTADASHVVEPAPLVPEPAPPGPAPDDVQPAGVEPEGVVPAVDPVLPDPVLPDPVLPDPVLPDPVLPDPVQPAPPDPAPGPRPVPPPGPVRPRPPPAPDPAVAELSEQNVKFVSTPPGATVEVAGVSHETPFEVVLGKGSHRWWAQQKNRKPREASVLIDAPTPETKVVDVSLEAETRQCFLTGENAVVEIAFSGYKFETFQHIDVPIGHHNVTAKLQNGTSARGSIDVPAAASSSRCHLVVSLSQVSVP